MNDAKIIKWFEIRVGNLSGFIFAERDEAYKRAIQVLKEHQEMQDLRKEPKSNGG